MRLAPQFVRLVPRLSPPEVWLGCVWAVVLTGLEIAGRRFPSDILDGAVMFVLCLLGLWTITVHNKHRLSIVTSLRKVFRFLFNAYWQWMVDVGVDLSRSSPLPRRIPPKWIATVTLLALLVGALVAIAPVFPSGARKFLAAHFYLLLLAVEGLVWIGLSFGIAAYSFAVWGRLHDWLVERHRAQQPRSIRIETRATWAIFALILGCVIVIPIGLPLVAHAFLLVVGCIASLMASPGLEVVWRYRSGGPIRVFDGRWMLWIRTVGSILLAMMATLITGGECLWEMPYSPYLGTAPVTVCLGRVFAWSALAGNVVVTYYAVRYAALGILFHQWPFSPAEKQLRVPEDRRSEIQSRREIIRRLQMLFRRVARQQGARGSGLWIGLQHWFVLGLSRDSTDNDEIDRETTLLDDIIGPPYHRVFTSTSRRHFQRITEALQVDLIYVENGVSFPRLVRVLRMMFEIYDMYGGRQRAEEMHFTGLPGIRVVIHDFDLCHSPSHGRAQYPEPDYEHVGRARILHVFKDRGEADVDIPVPESWEGTPVFSGV